MSRIKTKGNLLAELRIKKGLTVRDLNELSGVNIAVISKTENGKNSPNPRTAKKYVKH